MRFLIPFVLFFVVAIVARIVLVPLTGIPMGWADVVVLYVLCALTALVLAVGSS